MTIKNAIAGLPHGGGKSGILAPPNVHPVEHERLIRSFAQAIADLTDYVPSPDMDTTETSMAYVHDEIGRAVGLPSVLGGIPLDEMGATGFGLAVGRDDHRGIGLLRLNDQSRRLGHRRADRVQADRALGGRLWRWHAGTARRPCSPTRATS